MERGHDVALGVVGVDALDDDAALGPAGSHVGDAVAGVLARACRRAVDLPQRDDDQVVDVALDGLELEDVARARARAGSAGRVRRLAVLLDVPDEALLEPVDVDLEAARLLGLLGAVPLPPVRADFRAAALRHRGRRLLGGEGVQRGVGARCLARRRRRGRPLREA